MAVKSNTLVKILVPATLLITVVIGVRACSHSVNKQTAEKTTLPVLTPEQLRELGVEGDTPQDTLNTLVAKLGDIQHQQSALEKQNRELTAQNQQLQSQLNNGTGVNSVIDDIRDDTQKALNQQQKNFTDKLNELKTSLQNQNHTSVYSDTVDNTIPVGNAAPDDTEYYQWINPQDLLPTENDNKSNPFGLPEAMNLNNSQAARNGSHADNENVEPVYTLPQNSTLTGSRAMTALLGRIPIEGKVTDPYPFKILIGQDNLTANGIELPDVAGAIVSGTASGDWTLSCVRGQINSITFVFTNGTVSSYPAATKDGNTQNQGDNNIGWLSDSSGIPCISGERKSNAASYLPTIGLLALGTSAGDALSASQYTNQAENGAVTSALSGSAGKAVLGQALGGSFREVAQWVKSRYGQTFDVIYVPPGASVAVHLTREIDIDYAKNGRQVKYAGFTLPASPLSTDGLD